MTPTYVTGSRLVLRAARMPMLVKSWRVVSAVPWLNELFDE